MSTLAPKLDSLQYDGTNGTYIAETYLDGAVYSVYSDTGTVLTLVEGGENFTVIPLNGWVVRALWNSGPYWTGSNTTYLAQWAEVPTSSELTLAAGYALTPSISGSGGTANVAVDLSVVLSNTSYQTAAVLAGTSALLSDLSITDVTITDTNTVTVEVTNNGTLALAGATVIVTAGELVSA
jgi:hypothetical protein